MPRNCQGLLTKYQVHPKVNKILLTAKKVFDQDWKTQIFVVLIYLFPYKAMHDLDNLIKNRKVFNKKQYRLNLSLNKQIDFI